MGTPLGAKLSGIQVLRGLAAVAVVLSHAARQVDKAYGAPGLIVAFQAGHAGVDLFFAISGFLLLYVHRLDIGRPARLPRYLGRRFSRIMPLYWVALALTIVMSVAGGHTPPSLRDLVWSFALLPSLDEPLLGIAWTLQFELVFYAVFAVLIISRAAGLALLMAWFGWIAIAAVGFGADGVPPPFCGIYGLEFFLGMGAAQIMTCRRLGSPRLIVGTAAGAFVAAMMLESAGLLNGSGTAARLAYGIPAGWLVLGVAAAEQSGRVFISAWMKTVGEASYSIYLFQFVFIGIAWQAWLKAGLDDRLPGLPCFLFLATTALVGGCVTARFVERPLLRLARGRPLLLKLKQLAVES